MNDVIRVTGDQIREFDHEIVSVILMRAYRKIADCVRNDDYYGASKVVDLLDDLGMNE